MIDQMQKDKILFEQYEAGEMPHPLPYIHVYQWDKPTLTYGYCQKIDLEPYLNNGFSIEMRPTGGGLVEHAKGSLSFTIIFPRQKLKVEEAILKTTQLIFDHLKSIGLEVKLETKQKARQANKCTDYISRNEIGLDGKKIVGIAQRFGKKVILQQGTIFGSFPQIKPSALEAVLK